MKPCQCGMKETGECTPANCEHDDNDRDPLTFERCDGCHTLTANYDLVRCTPVDRNREPEELCLNCREQADDTEYDEIWFVCKPDDNFDRDCRGADPTQDPPF